MGESLWEGEKTMSAETSEGRVSIGKLIAIPAVIWGVFEMLLGWELRTARHGSKDAI